MEIKKLKLSTLIASFFYVGFFPFAPGTAGSLVSVILIYFLPTHLNYFNITTIIFLLLTGVITCACIEKTLKIKDPSWAVIDEVLGMFLTCFWIHKSLLFYFLAFILFRLFDITKPYPIKHIEKIEAFGWGIMLDDIMAAFYASLTLYLLCCIM